MSAGSKVVSVRVGDVWLNAITTYLEERSHLPTVAPMDVSGFIRQAIIDKLAHIKRGRKKGLIVECVEVLGMMVSEDKESSRSGSTPPTTPQLPSGQRSVRA